ncbi:zinc finger protein 462-like [Genypterus blacodes]|uniref:zinc finger protein 462-like n=1 Tax=Genypterus blacodes TaxID=154954 RepID=UPI003F764E61
MQKDSAPSMHHQAATQDPQVRSFQCSHCVLIFKSKLFLLEHLNNVHGFNVDAALTNAGLKSSKISNVLEAGADAEDGFECRHCDFKARTRDSINKHEENCHKDAPQKGKGISKSPETETGSRLKATTNQQKEETGENVPSCSITSTSKTKCTTTTTNKNTKPPQSITKFDAASPGLNVKPPKRDGRNGVIILRDSRLKSSLSQDGVLKVAACSKIDIARKGDASLEQGDQFLFTNRSPSKPDNTGKRTRNDISASPTKRSKRDEEEASYLTRSKVEEERRKDDLVNNENHAENSNVYLCKHCDYSGVDLSVASSHYLNVHPYIRLTSKYIRDPDDHSATFRCLECPADFVTVAKLKRHYTENHPEAPDVFTMQPDEFSLGFRCFLCTFTANVLKALKEHHQNDHPTLNVDDPLMYCRYSSSNSREGPREETSSPNMSGGDSHTSSEGVRDTSSPQPAASKDGDAALYQCNHCGFGHNSVVVMFVHYQRSHPEETVTIDKIKQSAKAKRVKQSCGMDRSADSPAQDAADPPELEQTPPSSQKDVSFINRERRRETAHSRSETSKIEDLNSPGVKCKRKKSSTRAASKQPPAEATPPLDLQVFYCMFCSYCSNNVKSVIGHHNAKHFEFSLISTMEVLKHSAEVQNEKRQARAEASVSSTSPDSGNRKQVELRVHKESRGEGESEDEAAALSLNPYGCPENLFYCQKCNFANVSVKGLLNHQSKAHRNLMSSTDRVLRYTTVLRGEMAKLKRSRLPLPLMNNGDEMKFFCHLCNYRQKSVGDIVFHYNKRHKGFEVNAEKILKYTSTVHKRTSKRRLKARAGEEDGCGDIEDEDTGTQRGLPPSSSAGAPKSRLLQCYKCSYCTQHVYLLRKHLRIMHKSNRCFTDVLRLCFRQGALPLSYHCDMCVFSHEDAAAVLEHYQRRHPTRKVNLQFVNTQLYTGTTVTSHKKKKRHAEETDDDDPCSQAGQDDSRGYPCRACSFKGGSLQAIASHYRAVHPWSVKEDGSVLDVITSCQVEKNADLSDSLDTDTVAVKLETTPVAVAAPHETSISTKLYKCLYCSAAFNSSHGRDVHCGLKHREVKAESSGVRPDTVERGSSVHVYACPHCTYINTNHTGVTAHIQMKHPAVTEQDRPEMKKVLLSDVGERVTAALDGELKCSGYLCSLCPAISASTKKLKLHCHREHRLTVPSMLKVEKDSAATNHPSMHHDTQSSAQRAFFKKKTYAVIRCPYCKFVCKTQLALKQHIRLHHDDTSELKHQFGVYSCDLCPYTSLRPRFLGSHYTQKHGRAAFMKYYAPIFWEGSKKPKPEPVTEQPAVAPETCDPHAPAAKGKTLIYKCPRCTYVNISHHGTLTHCQMIHPAFTARADALQTEEVRMADMIGCMKRKYGKLIFGGHMCKMCPLIYPSLKKMKLHIELNHGETAPNAPKLPLQHSVRLKKQLLSKYRGTRSLMQGGFFKSKKYARIGCEFCKYSCSTKIALDRHMRTHHKPETAAAGHVLIYKCSQCPYSSLVKRFLRTHYTVRHGRASPFKYYVQQREQQIEMPEEADPPAAGGKGSLYECRLCVYSSRCRRYLSGHYKRVHRIGAHHPIRQQQIREWDENKTGTPVQAESGVSVQCIKCPDLFYDSPQLLSDHYSQDHSLDLRSDFTVLPGVSEKGSALYECGHCDVKIKGLRKLHAHLNDHREANVRMRTKVTEEAEDRWVKEAAAELEAGKTTLEEASAIPTSPPFPSAYAEEAEPTPGAKGFPCMICGRTFMSMVGLRVHERSHEATDSLKKLEALSTPSSRHIFDKYIIIKSGNVKPFQCSICLYRTNLMCLWKSHLIKKHEGVFMNPAEVGHQEEETLQVAGKESVYSKEEFGCVTQPEEEYERPFYLEPPDVQRQLNHYNLIAQANASAKAELQQATLPEDCVLYCEICNFTTEHLSSIRRHYLNRHGKKLLRCKGCSFVTSSRKDLELHMERGHTTFKAEPTHQKILHCPLCLYQTKTRNNMIDHIVLHREERVVPMEVRRPKLSRCLQGVVFRCHKCTFASASEENLRLHMMKHDDIRPYKCRLCYFDCATLSKLEAHLCDKHQVLRNHELVGQINLDQQEERLFAMSDTEENIQIQLLEGELEGKEEEEMTNLNNKRPHQARAGGDIEESTAIQEEEERGKMMGVEESAGTKDKSSASAPRGEDNVKPNSVDQQEQGQSVKNQAHTENAVQQTLEKEGKVNIKFEDEEVTCNGGKDPKKERDMDEDQAQPRKRDGKPDIIKHQKAEMAQGRKFKVEKNIDTKAEDDILRHILLLDDEGSISSTPKKWTEVKAEVTPTAVNKSRITVTMKPPERPTAEGERLTATHNHEHVSHKQPSEEVTSGVVRSTRKKGRAPRQENHREEHGADPYGDMPVLENEYLKEEAQPGEWCEKDGECETPQQRQDMADETTCRDGNDPCKGQESEEGGEKKEAKASSLIKGALAASDGDAKALHRPVKEENLFTCQLCGRSLMDGAQLETHIMRHGM